MAASAFTPPDARLPRVDAGPRAVPVWCLTPNRGGCLVRFFDTTALSPGGRRMACFCMPFEDRLPAPGDVGEVVVVDLDTGKERVVAETRGWEPQLGAQVQWGADDRTLFFGDVDPATWAAQTVRLDPVSGERSTWEAPIYHVCPRGRWVIGTHPGQMRRTQSGYGVVVPEAALPRRLGAPDDDGVWLTDATTGEKRLLHSLRSVVDRFAAELGLAQLDAWRIYAFHAKFAPVGDRLMFSLRWFRADYDGPAEPLQCKNQSGLRFAVFTSRLDGSDLCLAVGPEAWAHGGHHSTFTPDGQRLTMNLGGLAGPGRPADELRFAHVDARGGPIARLLRDAKGGGHPSVHAGGRHLLTDCYFHERWTDPATGTTPLRWLNLETGQETHVARVSNRPTAAHPTLRVDPHPAWDRTGRLVTFTATLDGTRRVCLADLSGLLDETPSSAIRDSADRGPKPASGVAVRGF